MYGNSRVRIESDAFSHKRMKTRYSEATWFLLQSHAMEHPRYIREACDNIIKEL